MIRKICCLTGWAVMSGFAQVFCLFGITDFAPTKPTCRAQIARHLQLGHPCCGTYQPRPAFRALAGPLCGIKASCALVSLWIRGACLAKSARGTHLALPLATGSAGTIVVISPRGASYGRFGAPDAIMTFGASHTPDIFVARCWTFAVGTVRTRILELLRSSCWTEMTIGALFVGGGGSRRTVKSLQKKERMSTARKCFLTSGAYLGAWLALFCRS